MKRKSIELIALSAVIATAPVIASKQVITKEPKGVKSEIHKNTADTKSSVDIEKENTEKVFNSQKYINLARKTNNYDEKISLLNKVLKKDPSNIIAWLAKIHVMKSNPSNTINNYQEFTNQMVSTFSDSPINLFTLAVEVKDEFLKKGNVIEYNDFVKQIKSTLENVKDPKRVQEARCMISLMPMYDMVEQKVPSTSNDKNKVDNKKQETTKVKNNIDENKKGFSINNNKRDDTKKDNSKTGSEVLIKIINPATGKAWANHIVHVYEQYINTGMQNANMFMVMPIEEKTYETNSSGEIAIYDLSPGTVQLTVDYGNGQELRKTVVVKQGNNNAEPIVLNNDDMITNKEEGIIVNNINQDLNNTKNMNRSSNSSNNNYASNHTNKNNDLDENKKMVIIEDSATGKTIKNKKIIINGIPMETNSEGQVCLASNDSKIVISGDGYNTQSVEINNDKVVVLPDTGIASVAKKLGIEVLVAISIFGTLGFTLNKMRNKKVINR